MATLATPNGSWFTPGLKFYGVDLAPLRVTAKNAETLLAERDTPGSRRFIAANW